MIKVTLPNEEKTVEAKPFPKLMITQNGKIVFFIKPKVGMAIKMIGSDRDSLIDFYGEWVMEQFTDYNEPITIQNA